MSEAVITAGVKFEASTGENVCITYNNELSPCVRLSIIHGMEGEKKFFVMNLYADDLYKFEESIRVMRAILNR